MKRTSNKTIKSSALTNSILYDETCIAIIDKLGYDNVKQFIPFSITEIADALAKGDTYLNTLPLRKWDEAAGYKIITNRNCQNCIPTGTGLASYAEQHGVDSFSLGDLVCILKRCAVMEIQQRIEQLRKDMICPFCGATIHRWFRDYIHPDNGCVIFAVDNTLRNEASHED